MSAAASSPSSSAQPVTGYVEAVTLNAVHGWAWRPGSAEPVAVELRLEDRVVAQGMADELREDLARNGVGQGRHAFTLAVPGWAQDRLGELAVIVRLVDGSTVTLSSPPAEDSVSDRLTQLHRGMEMMVASQRVLHRNLQSALLARAETETAPVATNAPVESRLAEQIATLELFVMRLDARLAAMATPPKAQAGGARWFMISAFALSAVAVAVSVWGMIHAMPG